MSAKTLEKDLKNKVTDLEETVEYQNIALQTWKEKTAIISIQKSQYEKKNKDFQNEIIAIHHALQKVPFHIPIQFGVILPLNRMITPHPEIGS